MNKKLIAQIAKAISVHFGPHCEVVYHDLDRNHISNSITLIENGHVTGRSVGDGPSQVVIDAMKMNKDDIRDHLGYRIHTKDGKMLKSSTIYVRDDQDHIVGILGINLDITELLIAERGLKNIIDINEEEDATELVTQNVNQMLEDLIEQSVKFVGRPVALMTKQEKKQAIDFLNEHGAFLITRSADRIAQYFGISKFSIYNYTNVNKSSE